MKSRSDTLSSCRALMALLKDYRNPDGTAFEPVKSKWTFRVPSGIDYRAYCATVLHLQFSVLAQGPALNSQVNIILYIHESEGLHYQERSQSGPIWNTVCKVQVFFLAFYFILYVHSEVQTWKQRDTVICGLSIPDALENLKWWNSRVQ